MYWRPIATSAVILSLAVPVTVSARTNRKPTVVPYGAPVELRIPKLSVTTKIEKTGINRQGVLEAPKNPKQAGWYRHGAIPGKQGNAVIGGHVDWYNGPAVFRRLGQLRRGDMVEVKNDHGQVLKFRVTGVGSYYNGSVPLARITGPTKKQALNLYTCTGRFNRSAKNYSHRVVVFTELVR
ncbi:MAG: class F sortase [Candidatus Kerfeldbacteria bacterium]|nr:class F sortase [Candidatus Kerfeldbacteria bacterium]